ncbi:type II toxin-antitoxin system RelE/ParE family toxin [Roseospira goensis]|uniref:type II toxin-antitoxin system RelE/ParE family toxin n=1 Tax=Roseospira goensis TaxID=391922 RepID=UPI00160C44EF|nr:type II toxin-antitoxin system RelE/ParE family toxin [Roseospira goensis]
MGYEILNYLTDPNGRDPFYDWFSGLKDRQAQKKIARRLNRLELGNFGDCEPCRDGVWELRFEGGSGYRVYYAIPEAGTVLLLCGGDKSSQDRDIDRACRYWREWQQRA